MKFKVGSIIRTRNTTREGDIVDCEGIIIKHWKTPNSDTHNISLFVTFDQSFPQDVGSLQDYYGFKPSRWEQK